MSTTPGMASKSRPGQPRYTPFYCRHPFEMPKERIFTLGLHALFPSYGFSIPLHCPKPSMESTGSRSLIQPDSERPQPQCHLYAEYSFLRRSIHKRWCNQRIVHSPFPTYTGILEPTSLQNSHLSPRPPSHARASTTASSFLSPGPRNCVTPTPLTGPAV